MSNVWSVSVENAIFRDISVRFVLHAPVRYFYALHAPFRYFYAPDSGTVLSLISPTPSCPVTIMFLLLLILILVTLFSVLPNYSYDISRFVSISANTFIFTRERLV